MKNYLNNQIENQMAQTYGDLLHELLQLFGQHFQQGQLAQFALGKSWHNSLQHAFRT